MRIDIAQLVGRANRQEKGWLRRVAAISRIWYPPGMSVPTIPRLESMSALEKLELVDELWKSIGSDLSELELTPEQKELLEGRWAEYLAHPNSAISLTEFEHRLKALRG